MRNFLDAILEIADHLELIFLGVLLFWATIFFGFLTGSMIYLIWKACVFAYLYLPPLF